MTNVPYLLMARVTCSGWTNHVPCSCPTVSYPDGSDLGTRELFQSRRGDNNPTPLRACLPSILFQDLMSVVVFLVCFCWWCGFKSCSPPPPPESSSGCWSMQGLLYISSCSDCTDSLFKWVQGFPSKPFHLVLFLSFGEKDELSPSHLFIFLAKI